MNGCMGKDGGTAKRLLDNQINVCWKRERDGMASLKGTSWIDKKGSMAQKNKQQNGHDGRV